jgi:SAM-dependent methyltransferase
MSAPVSATPVAQLHTDAVAAYEAGDVETAVALLREAATSGAGVTVLNDLAVVLLDAGDLDDAAALLRACVALDPDNADARENAAVLEEARAAGAAAWRGSQTLGGGDLSMPERAYPGMPGAGTMSEHAMRYSLALGLLPHRHVLDVGCGTGYGSEMLTWVSKSVRGFDLWEPADHERPQWLGGAELTYGFDVCKRPLPPADAAVMFEVIEHLPEAPVALRNVFGAVDTLLASFPNPTYHGSHLNHHHVNDWTLEQFEEQLMRAAATRFNAIALTHLHQPHGFASVIPGRDPESPFWVVLAEASEPR